MNGFLNFDSSENADHSLILFRFTFRPIDERPSTQQGAAQAAVQRVSGTEALLTAGPAFGRLSPLTVDEGSGMAEHSYEQMQRRALNNLDNASGHEAGSEDQAAWLARGQVHALLAVGAAIRDLAQAVREKR